MKATQLAIYRADCNSRVVPKAVALQGVELTKERSLKSGIVGKPDPVISDVGQQGGLEPVAVDDLVGDIYELPLQRVPAPAVIGAAAA